MLFLCKNYAFINLRESWKNIYKNLEKKFTYYILISFTNN